jgi:hypothetical protein
MARTIIEESRRDWQRTVRWWHVDRLALAMQRGEFPQSTMIVLSQIDGQWVLIDGQHRLLATSKANIPQQFVVTRCIGMSEASAADLYGVTDINVCRTTADDSSAHRIPESTGLTKTQVNVLGAATEIILTSFHRAGPSMRPSLAARRTTMLEWSSHFKTYSAYTSNGDGGLRRGLLWQRAPIAAVGIVTIMASRDSKAEDFWRGISRDDGLRAGDARKALLTWLSYRSISGRGTMHSGLGQVASRDEQSRAVATAWNAFYDGRSLSFVRVIDERAPIVIRGTGYDGKDND